MSAGQSTLPLVAVTACVVCAGLSLHRVFPLGALSPVVLAAGLIPAAISVGLQRFSLWLAVPASVAGWLAVAVAILRGHPGQLVAGVRDTWLYLLDTILPAPARPALLVGVSALVWLGAATAAELTVRTRHALAPLAPPLAVLLAGVMLSVGGPGSNLPVAAAFVPLAAVAVLARQSGTAWRRYLVGVPLAAGLALVAVAVGPRLPVVAGRAPLDLRTYVRPATQPETAVDPLGQLSGWLATPNLTLFTVRAGTAADWRIAVLDRFDGQAWTISGKYLPTGSRVPQPEPSPNPVRVRQSVTIRGLTGVWLPAAEQPVSLSGTPVVVDTRSGSLISPIGVSGGLTYQAVSEVPRWSTAELRSARPDQGARADLAVPDGMPQVLRTTAQQATAGATFPFQQATRLERYLRTSAVSDPKAAPGHSYGHLAYFLSVTHRGTSEQFATAFALMARSLGLPTRVVVGFQPGIQVSPGEWVVRGQDALAWPEVKFAGTGWVPFFPTPNSGKTTGDDTPPAGSGASRAHQDSTIDKMPITRASEAAGGAPTGNGYRSESHRIPLWTVAAAVPVGAALAYLAAVLAVPYLRFRRRRRSGTATGVWRQALEYLRPLHLPHPATRTTADVLAFAAPVAPAVVPHLATLAALVDAALYSGRPPDAGAVRAGWQDCRALRRRVRAAAGWRATLRYRLSPKVFPS